MVELRRKHDVYKEVPYQTDERRTTGDQGSGTSRRSAAYRQTLARILLMSDESRPNGGIKQIYPVHSEWNSQRSSGCVHGVWKKAQNRPRTARSSCVVAMLMAGIDGIINKIDPGEPLDVNIYDFTPEQSAGVQQVPGSLAEALDALEADNEFLLRGGVFTSDLIDTWISYKRSRDVDGVQIRPHPYEFMLYYDA